MAYHWSSATVASSVVPIVGFLELLDAPSMDDQNGLIENSVKKNGEPKTKPKLPINWSLVTKYFGSPKTKPVTEQKNSVYRIFG